MPIREHSREQAWLLPPSLDEVVADDHPVRFVALFVDALPEAEWHALGIDRTGAVTGAPAYAPSVLLSVWLYGFMSGVRSSRKLEGACRDQLPFLWLTGCQQPDHNTLWRFYEGHRVRLRRLLRRTVRTAVGAGLVALAVQAVDGTKVAANAAKDRTYDAKGLADLLARTEQAIADLEAQNATGGDAPPPRLPAVLRRQQALRTQVEAALAQVLAAEAATAATPNAEDATPAPNADAEPGARTVRLNLTDADAQLMKGRTGLVAGYNAQAMVLGLDAAKAGRTGLLIGAADLVTDADDHAQLVPLVEQARALVGQPVAVTAADGGYHSGENLDALAARGVVVVMTEAQQERLADPYHKDAFRHDPDADTYTCPQGQVLTFRGIKQRAGRPLMQVYRASGAVCRACPAFGVCTKDRSGRALEIGPHEATLRRHRHWMRTDTAKRLYGRRKELPEPAFGILKEQQGARRFLLRGLAAVRAEWSLLATAFNLRTLAAVWQERVRAGVWQGGASRVGSG